MASSAVSRGGGGGAQSSAQLKCDWARNAFGGKDT